MRLGTGDRQPEAVALYESSGWDRVLVGSNGRPVPARHIWFTKQLTAVVTTGQRPFELLCEIEPATTPDLTRVRHQIGVLSPVATTFLIPDNHIGRATVSSVAVAHEVEAMGGRSVACLNARDRNLLGFRRDLLTAAAYGVDQFLLVYGDEPRAGARTSELNVRTMLAEGRYVCRRPGNPARPCASAPPPGRAPCRGGSGRPTSSACRSGSRFGPAGVAGRGGVDVPVYAGVLVVASAGMARNMTIPGLTVPPDLVRRLERDRNAGVDAACDLVVAIRDSGAFDGVHLIPVARYREVAARLEQVLTGR